MPYHGSMARSVRRAPPMDGHDERNLARLSLVLANNRVPRDMTAWVKEFVAPDGVGTTLRVECTAPRDDVVPHGLDNDVLLGLVNAYIAAGMPSDGVVRLTAYALLQYSSLTDGGFHYVSLAESLQRFQGTVYKITNSWYDNEHFRYRTLQTSLLLKFVVIDRARDPVAFKALRAESLLELTLDSDLTASIRSGFIRPLDLEFLRLLHQPLPRLLFRVLSEQRHPGGQPPASSYQVHLKAWGQHLGILDDRASRIRRSLEPAHEQLVEKGFLRGVEYIGRGESQQVVYTFAERVLPPAHPETVALLTQRGVSHAVAVRLAAEYGPEAVGKQVQHYDSLIAGGYRARSKAALLVDVIRSPDKYVSQTRAVPVTEQRRRTPAAPEPLLDPPRTTASARILLKGLGLPEHLMQDAAELFVEERVSVAELLALRQVEDPVRTVTLWGARRL